MKFFIDTASLDQIRQGAALGVIDGVTTNPSLMAKEGIKGKAAIEAHYQAICGIVDGDISAEVLSTTFDAMIVEGQSLAALHKNIVVKVPCTLDGIKAIKWFADHSIRTNCTLVFTVGQAVLAAKAGATYVSPFVGRLDDISSDGVALVADIVEVFRTYGYRTQVLAASIRHTQHIIDCMMVGAHVATCPLAAIVGLLKHPLTDSGLATFMADTQKMQDK
ncbi:MAG: fructose-6-phosphate aldolase [Mucinivorans sp.]